MIDLLPADLGIDSLNFPTFRSYKGFSQWDTVVELGSSSKRFSLLDMSTGGGKSLTYVALAKLLDARTLILTVTKALQDQVMRDFESSGLRSIKGESNYRCLALDKGGELHEYGYPGTSCADGPCKVGVECSLRRGGCLKYDALTSAKLSRLVVTNYDKWMTMGRYESDGLGSFDLLVLDEAHEAPNKLNDFCVINLDKRLVNNLLNLDLPPVDDIDVWSGWAGKAAVIADGEYRRLRRAKSKSMTREVLDLMNLSRDLLTLSSAPTSATQWIGEILPRGVRFSPVSASEWAESLLFRGVPKVLMTSATLDKSVARRMAVSEDSFDYFEAPSTFDPRRRPFIYIPTTRVSGKPGGMTEGQKRQLVNRVDQIIEKRLDRRGIIHTKSYDRAREIVERSKFNFLMLTHTKDNTREVVEKFKQTEAPCVLVSPSVESGHDFKLDQCRYQILVKVPYVNATTDKVMKARLAADRGYGDYLAQLAIVQMVGRSTRSMDDASEVFILDDHFSYFRNKVKWAKWFKLAMRQESSVPDAMDLGA